MSSLDRLLEGSHEPFCCTIWWALVRRATDVFQTVLFKTWINSFTVNWGAIIGHNLLRKSISCKQFAKLINGLLGRGVTPFNYFWPLGVSVHTDQQHLPIKGACKIKMNSIAYCMVLVEETGKALIWARLKHDGMEEVESLSGRGSRDNPSALLWLLNDL